MTSVFETIALYGTGNLLAWAFLPAMAYAAAYLVFRFCGKVSVNARGWHAGSVYLGRRVVLSAVLLFAFFQPLMRMESRLARGMAGSREKNEREPGVSDVVVELVPMA